MGSSGCTREICSRELHHQQGLPTCPKKSCHARRSRGKNSRLPTPTRGSDAAASTFLQPGFAAMQGFGALDLGLCPFPAALPSPAWHQQRGHSSFHLFIAKQVLQGKRGDTKIPPQKKHWAVKPLPEQCPHPCQGLPPCQAGSTSPDINYTAKMTLTTPTEQTPRQAWSQLCFQAWCVEELLDTKVKPLPDSKRLDAKLFSDARLPARFEK